MPTIHRGYRYKLRPTAEQEAAFRRFAGVCRFVYNLALEQREKMWTYYRDNNTPLNFYQQSKELTQLRSEVDWIAEVPQTCLEASLRDLDGAYARFFAGQADYPRYHTKGTHESFRYRGREVRIDRVNDKWGRARLPKIGWVDFRWTRDIPGSVKTVTIKDGPHGWHVTFSCEVEQGNAVRGVLPAVGIDRGVAQTLTLSTGEFFGTPDTARIDLRMKRAQRMLARRKRGSARYRQARARVAALAAKRARVRRHWQHVVTTGIAARFGTVVIEDLNVTAMTASGQGKRGLNRSILAQGWTSIATMLDYKLAERGGSLVSVPAAYSSQTCSCCGAVDKASRKNQATFACVHCGFKANADHNAAIVILRRNTASMGVEGAHQRPREASTGSSALAA